MRFNRARSIGMTGHISRTGNCLICTLLGKAFGEVPVIYWGYRYRQINKLMKSAEGSR